MRIDNGKLRAYLDQSLIPEEAKAVDEALAASHKLQLALTQLRLEREQIGHHLSALAPTNERMLAADRALERLHRHVSRQSAQRLNSPTFKLKERINTMINQTFMKRNKPAVIGLSLLLVVALLFSFAPVRAGAANLLTIFRVQQVKIVRVDMNHLDNLKNDDELSGLLDQFDPEPDVVSGGGEPREVDSVAEAAGLVDFSVAEIGAVPDDAGDLNKIVVHEETIANLNLDKELLESIFEAAGIELSLPDSLNEKPIVITKPASIHQQWGTDESSTLRFVQLRSPQIDHPDDLDLNEFGVAILQFLGKSKEEAEALGSSIDWANTLLLPVPSDEDVTASEVSVNGADGVVFTHKSDDSAVMWNNNGVTYMLNGSYSPEQILEIARSVQ